MMAEQEQTGQVIAYIVRETIVSAAINGVISALSFLAIFGTAWRIAAGEWGYAIDFLPQSAAVALMACMVPGMIARRAQRTGRLAGDNGRPVTVQWLLRTAFVSVLYALLLGAVIASFWMFSIVATLDWPVALLMKIIYGAVLGAWVTRHVLRRMVRGAPLT